MGRLIRMRDVMHELSLSRSTIYLLIEAGELTKHVLPGVGTKRKPIRFDADEIERIKARGADGGGKTRHLRSRPPRRQVVLTGVRHYE